MDYHLRVPDALAFAPKILPTGDFAKVPHELIVIILSHIDADHTFSRLCFALSCRCFLQVSTETTIVISERLILHGRFLCETVEPQTPRPKAITAKTKSAKVKKSETENVTTIKTRAIKSLANKLRSKFTNPCSSESSSKVICRRNGRCGNLEFEVPPLRRREQTEAPKKRFWHSSLTPGSIGHFKVHSLPIVGSVKLCQHCLELEGNGRRDDAPLEGMDWVMSAPDRGCRYLQCLWARKKFKVETYFRRLFARPS